MSNCILCDQEMRRSSGFIPLLLFQKDQPSACESCLSQFEPVGEGVCLTCQKEGAGTECPDCAYWQSQGLEVAHSSLFRYNDAMAAYFSRFKFQGDYLLRMVFARELKKALGGQAAYTLVPIPLSQVGYEKRGFNQVTALLEAAGLPYQEILNKADRDKQSSKSRTERLESDQPFFIRPGQTVPENILLVDDVYTTGATIQHAKGILMKMGAKKIKTFSLAR